MISMLPYSKFTFSRPSELVDETKGGEVCTDDVVGTSERSNMRGAMKPKETSMLMREK